MPQPPRSARNTPEHLAALQRGRQHHQLLILRDSPTQPGDRSVPGTDRSHADLVRPRLRADLRPPLLRIDTLRRAHIPTTQELRIIAARTLEIVLGDPPKPLVMLGRHAASR